MEFCLKWVHMAQYELILRLDGALWLRIIFKPLLPPKSAITIQFESYFWFKKYEIWSEMDLYGSVGAYIKTGRSPVAHDHLKTPPDPKKGHGIIKHPQKSKRSSRVGQEGYHESTMDITTS